jgi:hypothetical protein
MLAAAHILIQMEFLVATAGPFRPSVASVRSSCSQTAVMALIDPFRRWIVYPQNFGQIREQWNRFYADLPGCSEAAKR